MTNGTVVRIVGPVLDVQFEQGTFPPIHTLLYVLGNKRKVAVEVMQHRADAVRCIALEATEGLSRGLMVENTGSPIKVPVGRQTLGRAMEDRKSVV